MKDKDHGNKEKCTFDHRLTYKMYFNKKESM